ncbi:DedA family protein [Neobacillus sp. Marseille-QA0830]
MSHLITLFEQYSYLILFLGIFLELMALPISGEFLMSYAGYFVYQGKMNYPLALLMVFLSGGAGITATYWIGRAGGYRLIEKYGRFIHLGPERYKKAAGWLERYGNRLLVFAYFIPGIRHFTGYISGISRMPFRKFIVPAYTGAFLWGVCFVTLGKMLGPKWEVFHQAARKYFIIFIIGLVVLVAGYFTYRYYKVQIKAFFIGFIQWLLRRLKSIKATGVFLFCLSVALIGLVTLMLGMAQDYLFGEFHEFNEVTKYIVLSSIYRSWMKGLLFFQTPYVLGTLIVITLLIIWKNGENRLLEYLLLIVPILGARLYHESIVLIFSYLQSIGFVGEIHSANFPDLGSTFAIIIYGSCLFLLVRHSTNTFATIMDPLIGVFLLLGLAIVKIASTGLLPSDIFGGYVYGGVWIFFNFLLFEMLRLVLDKY